MSGSGWVAGNDFIDQYGNLTLGNSGYADNAGDATHPYAKNDIWIPVSAAELSSDTQPALTYDANGAPKRTLIAATTHKVTIPFMPIQRSFVAPAGRSANPHGTKIQSLALSYRVNAVNLTSITMAIMFHSMAPAAAVPTPTAPTVTLTGGTLTFAANQYLLVAAIAAANQLFLTTLDQIPYGIATIVTPSGGTLDLLGASWRCSMAMY